MWVTNYKNDQQPTRNSDLKALKKSKTPPEGGANVSID
jgi:hypothetical protein